MSFRRPILFVLAVLLAAAPLLNCLPTPNMTAAEMACCQKMAGNCDMGAGNHSCCKTTSHVSQLVAALAENPQVHPPDSLVTFPILSTDVKAELGSEEVRIAHPSPIPISPPGLQSILRI